MEGTAAAMEAAMVDGAAADEMVGSMAEQQEAAATAVVQGVEQEVAELEAAWRAVAGEQAAAGGAKGMHNTPRCHHQAY